MKRKTEWHRSEEQPWDCWLNGDMMVILIPWTNSTHHVEIKCHQCSHRMCLCVCDGIYSMHILLMHVACCLSLYASISSHLPTINELDAHCFDFVFTTSEYFSHLVSENRLACWIEISAYLVNIRTNRQTPTQTLVNKRSRTLGMYYCFLSTPMNFLHRLLRISYQIHFDFYG